MNIRNCFRWCAIVGTVFAMILTSDAAPASESGIEGVISVSPARPGPQRMGEEARAAVADIEFIVQKGETKVSSFTTNAQGRFQVSLAPGHYVVCRTDPGAAIGHWRFEVDVVAGEMAKVNWTGDSGMR